MSLLTKRHRDQLLRNGRIRAVLAESGRTEADFVPVVKLFTPDADCTWLLTEIDPEEPDIAFGLCDLGMGCPELGNVSLSELESVRGRVGLPVERDRHFAPMHVLSIYTRAAQTAGAITEDRLSLAAAAAERAEGGDA